MSGTGRQRPAPRTADGDFSAWLVTTPFAGRTDQQDIARLAFHAGRASAARRTALDAVQAIVTLALVCALGAFVAWLATVR
jgi:hypothetical protein